MRSEESFDMDLNEKIRNDIAQISSDILDKYGNLKVALNIPTTARLIFDRLVKVEEAAIMTASEIQNLMNEAEKENPERLSDLSKQVKSSDRLIEFIQMMKNVEEQIIILRSATSNKMDWANAIIACKDYLSDIGQLTEGMKQEDLDISEPLKHFSAEFSQLTFQCRYFLSAEYEAVMKLPKISKHKKDHGNISISIQKIGRNPLEVVKFNQTLSAMNMIGQLSERLESWKIIVEIFCDAIITSRNGENVYHFESPTPNFIFSLHSKSRNKKEKSMDVEKVLKALGEFFTQLADVLSDFTLLDATTKSFLSLLGAVIEEKLIQRILKDVIAIAAPVCKSGNEDQEYFKKLIGLGEQFVDEMKEIGLFSQSSKLLLNKDMEHIFVSRRCFAIVSEASRLIGEGYTITETVGSGGEIHGNENSLRESYESIQNLQNEEDIDFVKKLMSRKDESHFPPLFSLQKCIVSSSAVAFVELLKETMHAAFKMKDESVRDKLALTAQNIVRLFVIQSPRKHASVFNSVPTMAAIFYNNCYYIAHCIMTMPLEVREPKSNALLESLLVDSICRLREVAATSLETTLTQCRRDLSVYLEDHEAFEHFPRDYKLPPNMFKSIIENQGSTVVSTKSEPKLIQSLAACVLNIQSISRNLREIMTEIVYCKSIGSLVSFLLDSVVRHVISSEDIRENDANAMADIFRNLLQCVDDIMMYRHRSRITEFCAQEYFRLHEIVFVLGNRMQDIEMRWFNGKGPMAEYLSRKEVIRLIQSLFADSSKRSECLARL